MVRKKQTSHQNTVGAFVSILALAFLGYAVLNSAPHSTTNNERTPYESSIVWRTYNNPSTNLIFDYPSHYRLVEYPDANDTDHLLITLTPSEQYTKNASPITVHVIQNALAKRETLIQWMKKNPVSNFSATDGTYQTTTIGDREIVAYRWQKIYPGITILFKKENAVIILSTTAENNDTLISPDFESIIKTFSI